MCSLKNVPTVHIRAQRQLQRCHVETAQTVTGQLLAACVSSASFRCRYKFIQSEGNMKQVETRLSNVLLFLYLIYQKHLHCKRSTCRDCSE